MHICMVVFGDLSFDFRVYREAIALREAGHNESRSWAWKTSAVTCLSTRWARSQKKG